MKRILIAALTLMLGTVYLAAPSRAAEKEQQPIKVLVITGQHGHKWQETTPFLKDLLEKTGRFAVDVTTEPANDLTPANCARYDVFLFNYRDQDKKRWPAEAEQALLGAVAGGKGFVVYHHASSAFLGWSEFERMIGGGWRDRGYHGPMHQYRVSVVTHEHPITAGLPDEFLHGRDELYQNSLQFPENQILAMAYSDPALPRGTGLFEALVWVKQHGEGRIYHNALGHDVEAMQSGGFQVLITRGVEWAATGKVTIPVPETLDAPKPEEGK